jgi:hypothetical protein
LDGRRRAWRWRGKLSSRFRLDVFLELKGEIMKEPRDLEFLHGLIKDIQILENSLWLNKI